MKLDAQLRLTTTQEDETTKMEILKISLETLVAGITMTICKRKGKLLFKYLEPSNAEINISICKIKKLGYDERLPGRRAGEKHKWVGLGVVHLARKEECQLHHPRWR
ncbi:hypothetical protein NC651_000703 [Populus alba x Populus x berolinensis]|nr:hypothetical protein NC651_000703 [Populus alba x Populus x berolinensis]